MTRWYNYGVKVSDSMVREKVASILKQHGFTVWSNNGNEVRGGKNREIDFDEIESDLSMYSDKIEAVIIVDANDTDDSAIGKAYEFEDDRLVKQNSDYSGGESTRHNWIGIKHNGLKMDGGKYF